MKESVRRDFWRTMFLKHVWKIEFLAGVAWSIYAFFHGKHERMDIGGITILGSLAIVFLASSILSLHRRWTIDIIAAAAENTKKSGFSGLDVIAFFLPFLGGGMILAGYRFARTDFMYCSLLNIWGAYLIVLYSAIMKRLRYPEAEKLNTGHD